MQLAYQWSLYWVTITRISGWTELHNKITSMQFGAFSPNGTGRCGRDSFKPKQTSGKDRPAIGIWPDRGEPQPCVWCHSSESHQSHTRWNTSVSQTHNCLPLRKHSGKFTNMLFKWIGGWGWCRWRLMIDQILLSLIFLLMVSSK